MQEFTNWTINSIREDILIGNWMEERKFDWIPLVAKAITNIIEKNRSVLIITDNEHIWFKNYILANINKKSLNRPMLPFYAFDSFTASVEDIKTEVDIQLIKDMLNISFPNGYFFWYIGKSKTKFSTLAKISEDSFLWLMDEDTPESFFLNSQDEALDIRLLNMFRLFNKTLAAVLFAEIDVHN